MGANVAYSRFKNGTVFEGNQGVMLLTVGRSFVGNDDTHSTLLDRACASAYENLPKYCSYRISNTAPRMLSLDKDKSAVFSVLTDVQKCNSDEITIASFHAHRINYFIECISMYTERNAIM